MTGLKPVVAALLMLLGAPVASLAQSPATEATNLTVEDMRVLAQQLLDAGRPSDAGQVLNAVLARDPSDYAALILGAQAALNQNQPAAAVDLARRGYRFAPDDTARYVAARLAARGHAELRQDTRAQFWLRRARQVAPDAANADSVAQDYAFLRDRNPLSFNLEFGATPSNNINNGSRSETATIGPFVTVLSESAKPLSGIQFDAAATLRYVIRENELLQQAIEFDVRTTTYALSQSSKDALQRDIERANGDTSDLPRNGSDFSYTEASVNFIQRSIFFEGSRPTTIERKLGRSWYGGDPYQIFVQTSVSHTFALTPSELVRLDAFLRYNWADRPERRDATGTPVRYDDVGSEGLGATYSRVLDNGNLVSLSLAQRLSFSDNSENDFSSKRIGVGLDLGQPIKDIRFGFGAQFEERKFGESVYTAGIRRDRTVTAQVSARMDAIEYYGFTPAVTLSVGRTFSRAERFDTQYGNLGIDLRSAF